MTKKCPMCGAPMENGSCGYCGYKEEIPANSTVAAQQGGQSFAQPQIIINNQVMPNTVTTRMVSSKSKMVALLLCIFTGYLGIHRFYVGKIGSGIIYFLTMGLFGIGWIIDIISIAAGSFKDKYGMPLHR